MTKSGKLWGGRFTEKPDETFAVFNDSFRFDWRLFLADAQASIAHANGLLRAGVLSAAEAAAPGLVATREPEPTVARSEAGMATVTWVASTMVVVR